MKATRIALLALALVMVRQALFAQPARVRSAAACRRRPALALRARRSRPSTVEAGVERSVTTGPDGDYLIENLPVTGTYELRASLEGFAPVVRNQVSLTPGGRDTIGFLLVPFTSETLSVTARTAVRELRRSAIQQTIPERLARNIPLIGRDFIALSALTPGLPATRTRQARTARSTGATTSSSTARAITRSGGAPRGPSTAGIHSRPCRKCRCSTASSRRNSAKRSHR